MRYRSTYIEDGGQTVTAVLEAPDEQQLHEQLHRQGRTLLRVRPVDDDDAPAVASSNTRLKPARVLVFLQALQNSLEAGVPLLTALAALQEQEPDDAIAAVYGDIRDRIAGGQPLSEALAQYPRTFPPVSCALVRVGETSGNLPAILGTMVEFLEWRASIAGTVKQATIYPAVVMCAGYGLLLFLMSFVIPKLGGVLEKIGSDLPPASRMLIEASKFVSGHVLLILLATVVVVAALIAAIRTDRGRLLFAAVFSRFPIAATIVRNFNLVQMCRNLSVMLDAGITLPAAMEHTAAAVGTPRMRNDLLEVRERLMGGSKLTESFAEYELLPPIALSMIRVGEDSGRLPHSFGRLAAVYDREVRESVKRAIGLLEPLVTVVLGVVVGGVAVLVISTIYSAMKGLGK